VNLLLNAGTVLNHRTRSMTISVAKVPMIFQRSCGQVWRVVRRFTLCRESIGFFLELWASSGDSL
jgi:hypothetical protein